VRQRKKAREQMQIFGTDEKLFAELFAIYVSELAKP